MAAVLVEAASGTAIHAQSRFPAEVQIGAALLHGRPGVVFGGTRWTDRRSGVAARALFGLGYDFHGSQSTNGVWDFAVGSFRGLEVMYRYRAFRENTEIDLGIGMMAATWLDVRPIVHYPDEHARGGLTRKREWTGVPGCEFLVGWRVRERFRLKAGLGGFTALEASAVGVIVKFMGVVPLGDM